MTAFFADDEKGGPVPPDFVSTKWHIRFLTMAKMISTWSKDPSTKCGAVIFRPDKTIASVGFNGFPKGINDDAEIYNDRSRKYSRVIHAEMNAILNCNDQSLKGYGIATWPPSDFGSCDRCLVHIVQSGIDKIVFAHDPTNLMSKRQEGNHETTREDIIRESGIKIIEIDWKKHEQSSLFDIHGN